MISFVCPTCNKPLKVKDELARWKCVKCPGCGKPIVVPALRAERAVPRPASSRLCRPVVVAGRVGTYPHCCRIKRSGSRPPRHRRYRPARSSWPLGRQARPAARRSVPCPRTNGRSLPGGTDRLPGPAAGTRRDRPARHLPRLQSSAPAAWASSTRRRTRTGTLVAVKAMLPALASMPATATLPARSQGGRRRQARPIVTIYQVGEDAAFPSWPWSSWKAKRSTLG